MNVRWKRLREWTGAGVVALAIAKLFDLITDRVQAVDWNGVWQKLLYDPSAHVFMAMLSVPAILMAIYLKRYQPRPLSLDFEFLAQMWFSGMGAGFLFAMSVHFVRGTTEPIVKVLEGDPLGTAVLLWLTSVYLLAPVVRALFGLPLFVPAIPRRSR